MKLLRPKADEKSDLEELCTEESMFPRDPPVMEMLEKICRHYNGPNRRLIGYDCSVEFMAHPVIRAARTEKELIEYICGGCMSFRPSTKVYAIHLSLLHRWGSTNSSFVLSSRRQR